MKYTMNRQKACQHRPQSELKYNTINSKTYDVHSLINTPNAGKSVKALGPTHPPTPVPITVQKTYKHKPNTPRSIFHLLMINFVRHQQISKFFFILTP